MIRLHSRENLGVTSLSMSSEAGHVVRNVKFNNDAVSLRNSTIVFKAKKGSLFSKEEEEDLGKIELKVSDLRRNSSKTWNLPGQ
jgi:hypothetical protein